MAICSNKLSRVTLWDLHGEMLLVATTRGSMFDDQCELLTKMTTKYPVVAQVHKLYASPQQPAPASARKRRPMGRATDRQFCHIMHANKRSPQKKQRS
jgi:hypothetical protein